LGLVLGVAGIYALVLLFRNRGGTIPGDTTITTTTTCKSKVCREVVEVMDLTVNPCTNFYQYSCGNWSNKYPAPGSAQHWTNFVRLDRRNLDIIRRALEGRGKNKYKSKLMKKVKSFYEACKERDDETVEDVRLLVEELVEGLNLNITKENAMKDLAEISAKLMQEFGIDVLLKLSVGINDKNSSSHVLKIDQPQLTLPSREDYITNNNTKKLKNKNAQLTYMIEVYKLLNEEINVTVNFEKILNDVIDLEYNISAVELKPGDHRVAAHEANEVTIDELDKQFSFVDWKHFLNQTIRSKEGESVDGKEKMIVTSPEYFHKISPIINNKYKSKQGLKILEHFLLWRVFDSLVPLLSLPFRQARQDMLSRLAGAAPRTLPKSTWKSCVKETGKMFKFAIGHIYVKETESSHQNDKTKHAKNIFQMVKKALVKNLKKNQWMDKKTKSKAVEKSKLIEGLIGYPDLVMDKAKLTKMYAHLPEDSPSFPEALLAQTKRMRTPGRLMMRLRKPVAEHSWMTAPETINAFYTAVMNEIIIPLGILQPPFYKSGRPEVMNFGGIGFSIGHELTHAFDDNGRKYGGEGNLEDWWTKDTVDKFKQHTECLVEQYNNLTLAGQHVHGRNTLGENIADNGGLKAAFHGYFKDDHLKKSLPIKDLNFTSSQLFFISYAQVWCNANTDEYERAKIVSNPHPPSKIRVQATLANSQEFSEAFQCENTEGAQCRVW